MQHDTANATNLDKKVRSIIALGANLPSAYGSPLETLREAVRMMPSEGIVVLVQSRWFSSPAWPEGSGPDYINAVAEIAFGRSADSLLASLHRIETALGRSRSDDPAKRWASRPCDLDVISYGESILPSLKQWQFISAAPPEAPRPGAIIPHPLVHKRAFALVPLLDIAPNWRHPVLQKTISELVEALPLMDRNALIPLED